MVFLSLFLLSLPLLVFSAANSSNSDTTTCNPAHNGLVAGTLQFSSDCNATTWCNAGTCENKGCRRDRYPLGYDNGSGRGNGKHITPPALCPTTEFCPDEGSQCIQKVAVGQPCQFDRDDSCQAPDNFHELRDESGFGRNSNGSVCLNFVCQFANVTAGSQCEIENTGYVGYGTKSEFVYVVSRDNCKIGLYCDTNSTSCVQQKATGAHCDADKECLSYNCLPNQTCGVSPASPHHLSTGIYVIIGIGIFGGMIGTLVFLFFVHGRQRENDRQKRLQYWREQNAFRQNILQMHETAQASIFQGGGSRLSATFGTTTENSQSPMLQAMGHQYGTEEGSFEGSMDNEQLVMRTPYTHDNKI